MLEIYSVVYFYYCAYGC